MAKSKVPGSGKKKGYKYWEPMPQEHRDAISEALIGREITWSDKISKTYSDNNRKTKNHLSKTHNTPYGCWSKANSYAADVIEISSGKIIAKNVVLNRWCIENGLPRNSLNKVARGEIESYMGLTVVRRDKNKITSVRNINRKGSKFIVKKRDGKTTSTYNLKRWLNHSGETYKSIDYYKVSKRGTDEHKQRLSACQPKKHPWENGNHNKSSLKLWANLDNVYDWWYNSPYVLQANGKERGRGSEKLAKYLGISHTNSVRNVHNWVRTNGDPRQNADWVAFKEEYEKRME